jgi:hypothetical protein
MYAIFLQFYHFLLIVFDLIFGRLKKKESRLLACRNPCVLLVSFFSVGKGKSFFRTVQIFAIKKFLFQLFLSANTPFAPLLP